MKSMYEEMWDRNSQKQSKKREHTIFRVVRSGMTYVHYANIFHYHFHDSKYNAIQISLNLQWISHFSLFDVNRTWIS